MIQDRATTVTRWRRAREIFDDLVDLEPSEWGAQLSRACDDDLDLRREVESLLSHDRSSHDTIERLVAEAALDVDAGSTTEVVLPIPSVIGRYRILLKLGEGGMGEVFLAEDTSLGRRVALKVPSARLAGDSQMRSRLQQEARAAATINHPHVCVVHEVGEGPRGRPFIAMEYIEGETLADRIRRGRLPADEVSELGRQAASALHEAHSKGVVHRDLKPSNIMLTPHGVKLLDFGLASVTRQSPFAGEGTAAGGFAGTIPYMSPEQVRSEEMDCRTDVYSLGVVLYEAATGCRPFEAPTPRTMCEAILESDPRPARQIAGDVPASLERVIGRALAKNREERYQSAADLGADLVESVGKRAEEAGSRAPDARRLRRALAVVSAALVVAVTYWVAADRRRSPHRRRTPFSWSTSQTARTIRPSTGHSRKCCSVSCGRHHS